MFWLAFSTVQLVDMKQPPTVLLTSLYTQRQAILSIWPVSSCFCPFWSTVLNVSNCFLSTAFNAPHSDLHFQQYNCWHLCPFDPYQALSEASHCPFNQLHLKHQTLWLAFSTLATCQTGSSHSHSWQLAFHFVLTWSWGKFELQLSGSVITLFLERLPLSFSMALCIRSCDIYSAFIGDWVTYEAMPESKKDNIGKVCIFPS